MTHAVRDFAGAWILLVSSRSSLEIDQGLDGYAAVFVPGGQPPVVDLMQDPERCAKFPRVRHRRDDRDGSVAEQSRGLRGLMEITKDLAYIDDAAFAAHRATSHFEKYHSKINDLAEPTFMMLDPLKVA